MTCWRRHRGSTCDPFLCFLLFAHFDIFALRGCDALLRCEARDHLTMMARRTTLLWPALTCSVFVTCLVAPGLSFVPISQTQWTGKRHFVKRDSTDPPPPDTTSEHQESRVQTTAPTGTTNDTDVRLSQEKNVTTGTSRRNSLPGSEWIDQLLSSALIEVSVAYLVLLSSVLVAVGTLSLNPSWQTTIEHWQEIIAYVFVVEFVTRWYASDKGIFRYLSQPLVFVDVVVVIFPVILPMLSGIPPWLTSQTGLINLRLLRSTLR